MFCPSQDRRQGGGGQAPPLRRLAPHPLLLTIHITYIQLNYYVFNQ